MTKGSRAIVVGAGIGGLAAAAALSQHMSDVLVIDRDILLHDNAARLGVGQGAHTHQLLKAGELALERLSAWVGRLPEWRDLSSFLPLGMSDGLLMRSAIAATFAASLELVKSGRGELAQSEPFGPLLFRSR